jgi:hypothetical protein
VDIRTGRATGTADWEVTSDGETFERRRAYTPESNDLTFGLCMRAGEVGADFAMESQTPSTEPRVVMNLIFVPTEDPMCATPRATALGGVELPSG